MLILFEHIQTKGIIQFQYSFFQHIIKLNTEKL